MATTKFIEADEELNEYYTTGWVRAQSYEASGSSSYNPDEVHVAMLERAHRKRLERYAAVGATIAALPLDAKQVLEKVYAPHGAPDLLGIALLPTWGHGSLVRLAPTTRRAQNVYQRRHPNKPCDPVAILGFLGDEAGRGDEAAPMLARVKEAAEELRTGALAAYDKLRLERIETEKASARLKAAERERQLDADLGRKRQRESARYEARLRSSG